MAPQIPFFGRRLSMSGNVARKLRFDASMETSEILTWLQEAKDHAQYTILTFDEVTFTSELTAAVLELFRSSSRVGRVWDRLNIEFCVGPIDLIIAAATMMDCIKHLFFASDQNQDATITRFATTLRINTSLQSLWLLLPFSEKSAAALGAGLAHNDGLEKLSLSGSNWDGLEDDDDDDGDDGDDNDDEAHENGRSNGSRTEPSPSIAPRAIAKLSKGLAHNISLRTIDVSCCSLQDNCMAMLLGSLIGHPSLQHLDLSRNHCRERSIAALAEIVEHYDSKLVSLDLREQTRREPLGMTVFSQALHGNETLEKLKLSSNRLTDVQVVELVRSLKGNHTLQELDLQWNQITDKGLKVLTKHLSELPALSVLLLGGNAFGKEGKHMLESLEDDDDSICTIDEEQLLQQQQQNFDIHGGYSGSVMGGQLLGNINEDE